MSLWLICFPLGDEHEVESIAVSKFEPKVSQGNRSDNAAVWVRENLDALLSSNEYVQKHGLPLAKFNPKHTVSLVETKR